MLSDVKRVIAERPAGTRLLFLSDYDGTLAPFDPDPTIPRPTPQTAHLLGKLAGLTDLSFGIVSGRRVADLRRRASLDVARATAGNGLGHRRQAAGPHSERDQPTDARSGPWAVHPEPKGD